MGSIKEKISTIKNPSPERQRTFGLGRTISLTRLLAKNGELVLVQTDRALARFSGHVDRESRVLSYDLRNPFSRKPSEHSKDNKKKKFKFAVKGANEELPKMHMLVSLLTQLID